MPEESFFSKKSFSFLQRKIDFRLESGDGAGDQPFCSVFKPVSGLSYENTGQFLTVFSNSIKALPYTTWPPTAAWPPGDAVWTPDNRGLIRIELRKYKSTFDRIA